MDPDLEEYIEHNISKQDPYLKDIDRRTNLYRLNGRMCSGHIQGRLLKMLVAMIRPKRIVELGTFTGYSAICMAEALEDDSVLHTIEIDDELEEEITRNFSLSPHGHKIRLHVGDALEILDSMKDMVFDLAVIDADKRQYIKYFKKLLPMIRPGGFIIADNTLWDGHVTEDCRHSAQTLGILEFNDFVANYPDIEISIIPIRDGLSIIRKLPKKE